MVAPGCASKPSLGAGEEPEDNKCKEERNKNKRIETLLFPNMHTGNRCSKVTRAEVFEAKFICIDIAREGRNSV